METINPGHSDSGHNGDVHDLDTDQESPTLDTVSGFSTCSSPLPPEPFEPRYTVKFTGNVTKDGDIVKYTIKTQRVIGDGTEYIIQRRYEDFEWLEHCLVTSNNIHGIIIPPLPPRPPITSEMAEAKSKKQLGSNTKTLIGDEFHKDCRQLEQYLRLLLNHPLFGCEDVLEKFLTEKEPPARAKIKKGLFSKLSDSIENRKSNHKDCEEFFQKERDWVNKYGIQISECSEAYNNVVYAQQRLCSVLGHLATALTFSIGGNDEITKVGTKLCIRFSEALDDIRHGLQVVTYNDESTLGAYLDLYSRYIEAERDMLFRRTCLLVEYENSNKLLDKSKPNKREMAEQTKLAAEKAFEECSDVARQEIKKFHRQRVLSFQESLEKFADTQLKSARDMCAIVAKSITKLKQFEIAVSPKNEE
ncbi:sorting nexin-32-like [Centruroides sculpturatus]|uniref:sorting nexin-32-like n=1 Tax=Centruroides sculpturatus TaxID=218467 RepID=UPI000C6CB54B|nr:sorting nexin-32-like [Centruroides sculpturatus]